jgi:hypothetical protein
MRSALGLVLALLVFAVPVRAEDAPPPAAVSASQMSQPGAAPSVPPGASSCGCTDMGPGCCSAATVGAEPAIKKAGCGCAGRKAAGATPPAQP